MPADPEWAKRLRQVANKMAPFASGLPETQELCAIERTIVVERALDDVMKAVLANGESTERLREASLQSTRTLVAGIDRLVDASNSGTKTMSRLTRAYVWLTGVIAAATIVAAVATGVQVWEATRQRRIERSARWGELRNTMWEFFDMQYPHGVQQLAAMPQAERAMHFNKVRRVLDSQIGNPVLLDDRAALSRWRNAISTARSAAQMIDGGADPDGKLTAIHAGSIIDDVMAVWDQLVLKSTEVSPTGGRATPTR
jgi:hypothetical protein